MRAIASPYPDWKAPPEDGRFLIWPQPHQLTADTIENQRRLSTSIVPIQNVPLNQVRSAMRAFLGHDDARPLIANGHQTELYHAGVWAKDVLIHLLAEKLNGAAFHLAVDTDAPKHLMLRWPDAAIPITDDSNITTAAWCGLLAPPAPRHIDEIATQFSASAVSWSFQSMLAQVLLSLRRLSLESVNLSSALTNSLHELDWSLGLRHHALLVSPIWFSAPYLLFLHHVMSRLDEFAARYNAALHDYRDAHDMRTSTRPMPDLFISPDSIEAPFWLDNLSNSTRSRPTVFRAAKSWVLHLDTGDEFVFDPQAEGFGAAAKLMKFLAAANQRLAPRALTLTTFFRLFLADQFVHGIGGGRYDQVTDRLIARQFGIEPPKFSVTTATLLFPDAIHHQRACVPCVRHEGHALRHRVLGPRKMEFVRQIESLPRRSTLRSSTFLAMHNELDAAARRSPDIAQWARHLLQTQARQQQEQVLFDRELFYAIQSKDRFREMIDRYSDAFAAA